MSAKGQIGATIIFCSYCAIMVAGAMAIAGIWSGSHKLIATAAIIVLAAGVSVVFGFIVGLGESK